MCAAIASTGTRLRWASNRPLIRCRFPGPQLAAHTASCAGDRGLAGGRERGRLLVADVLPGDVTVAAQRVGEAVQRVARQPVDPADAGGLQGGDHDVGDRGRHDGAARRARCRAGRVGGHDAAPSAREQPERGRGSEPVHEVGAQVLGQRDAGRTPRSAGTAWRPAARRSPRAHTPAPNGRPYRIRGVRNEPATIPYCTPPKIPYAQCVTLLTSAGPTWRQFALEQALHQPLAHLRRRGRLLPAVDVRRELPRLEPFLAVIAAIPGVEQSVHCGGARHAGDEPRATAPSGLIPQVRAADDGRGIGPRRRCRWVGVLDEVLMGRSRKLKVCCTADGMAASLLGAARARIRQGTVRVVSPGAPGAARRTSLWPLGRQPSGPLPRRRCQPGPRGGRRR